MLRIAFTFVIIFLNIAPAAATPVLLTEYCGGGRISVERLARPVRHGQLCNTHRLWINGDFYLINAADADYLRKCCQAVIADVLHNGLYDARRGEIWDLGFQGGKR